MISYTIVSIMNAFCNINKILSIQSNFLMAALEGRNDKNKKAISGVTNVSFVDVRNYENNPSLKEGNPNVMLKEFRGRNFSPN